MLGKIDLLDFGSLSYRPDQVMKLKPLCETLIKYGWEPQISFQEGITQTIDWFVGKKVAPILAKNGSDLEFNLPVRL
jgi:nucleoside-diphosphate-sugar epimerase